MTRWWRYAVLRGPLVPPDLDGQWYDLDELPHFHEGKFFLPMTTVVCEPTDRWERREDGVVAVRYEFQPSSAT